MKTLLKATFALVVLGCAAAAQTGAPAAWTPELQLKVRGIASPRVSPDGRRVVYTVSDVVTTPERSEYVSQIWLAGVDGKESVQLTFADKSSTNPKWSPDGNFFGLRFLLF
ncbi:MAG: TolB family protein [Pyrinomonadaceae bacterium]